MRLVFLLLIKMPFWTYLIAAAGMIYLGEELRKRAILEEQAKAVALSQEPPDLVDLADFMPSAHIGPADEVNVTAHIAHRYDYELIEEGRFSDTVLYSYVLFGTRRGSSDRIALAGIILAPEQEELFWEKINSDAWVIAETDEITNLTLNGTAHRTARWDDTFNEVLSQENLIKSPDFFFLKPFLEGREVALAPTPELPLQRRNTCWFLAAGLVVFSFIRLVVARAMKKHDRAPEPADFSPHKPERSSEVMSEIYAKYGAGEQPVLSTAAQTANTVDNEINAVKTPWSSASEHPEYGPQDFLDPKIAKKLAAQVDFSKATASTKPVKALTAKQKLSQDPFARLAAEVRNERLA